MDMPIFKKMWENKYQIVSERLCGLQNIGAVATGFNTNIDAVCLLEGKKLQHLIENTGLNLDELYHIEHTQIVNERDFIKGVFKAFTKGIAEEWICLNEKVYAWIRKELGYDRLQIGGQGGIMANVLSDMGIKKVFAHANSLPKIQAEQFLPNDNLLSFDESGDLKPIYKIDRKSDVPLIHFIIEFKKGDLVTVDDKTFKCPRSNRFIATYDPLNLKLILDENFMNAIKKQNLDFVMLSGFHALLEKDEGVQLIEQFVPRLKEWKDSAKNAIFHIEIASTQDLAIRRAIIEKLVPIVHSIGVNERETMDLLNVTDDKGLAQKCAMQTTAENLLKGLSKIKEKTGVKRIQLHMFGLYMTLQDKNFDLSPQDNLKGMLTAAVVAAAKAKTGLTNKQNIQEVRYDVSDVGLIELDSLAIALGQPDLALTGIGRYRSWDLIVTPTILIESPKTLVGMGDTISSLSLVAAK